MAHHRLTHDPKTDETNFRSTRHTRAYVLIASVIIHFRYSFPAFRFSHESELVWCKLSMSDGNGGKQEHIRFKFFLRALEQKHHWRTGIFRHIKNQIGILEKSTLEQE